MKITSLFLFMILLAGTASDAAGSNRKELTRFVADIADTMLLSPNRQGTSTIMLINTGLHRDGSADCQIYRYITERLSALTRFRHEGIKLIPYKAVPFKKSVIDFKDKEICRELKKISGTSSADSIIGLQYKKHFRQLDIKAYLYRPSDNCLAPLSQVTLPITKKIKALLRNKAREELPALLDADICTDQKETVKRIIRKNHNNTSDLLVKTAMKIPVNSAGGIIHSLVIQYLIQAGDIREDYHDFILAAMHQIKPAAERTALSMALDMIQYLTADDLVDDEEWQACLNIIAASGDYHYIQSYLSALFRPPYSKQDYITTITRIDRYFNRFNSNTDTPGLDDEQYFTAMLSVLAGASSEFHVYEEVVYFFIRYYCKELQCGNTCFRAIKGMYINEDCSEQKNLLLALAAWYFNCQEPGETKARELLDFATSVHQEAYRPYGRRDSAPSQHLELFLELCGNSLAQNILYLKNTKLYFDAVLFCLSHSLPCNEITAEYSDIKDMLQSQDEETVLKALTYCIAQKDSHYKKLILNVIQEKELQRGTEPSDIIKKGIDYLAAVEAVDTDSLDLLTGLLKSRHYSVSSHSKEALQQFKSHEVLNHLIQTIQGSDDFTALQSIIILREAGMLNKVIRPVLQRIIESQRSPWLIDEAKQALAQVPSK